MQEIIIKSFNIAVFAIVWVFALAQADGIFGFIPTIVTNTTNKEWIHKITYECEKCIAGQTALWYCVLSGNYSLEQWTKIVITILYSIFFSIIFAKYINH